MRKNTTKTLIFAFATFLIINVTGCALKGPYRCKLGMYHGKIYDVDTNEPIEGAVVHVTYSAYGATVAGAIGVEVAVRETLTNAKGEYLIPEDTEMHECFSGKLKGQMTIFKPGYGKPGHTGYTKTCPEEEKEVIYSSHGKRICVTREGKYLIWGLPKLKTKEERKRNIPSRALSIPIEKQILLTQAINEERVLVGLSPLSNIAVDREIRCLLPPYKGRLIERDTEKPIEGAVIHVTYGINDPPRNVGYLKKNIAVRETLTNSKGEFSISPDHIVSECPSGVLSGELQIFKPGYGLYYSMEARRYTPENIKKIPTAIVEFDKYLIYELPKLETGAERANCLIHIQPAINISSDQQPLLLKAIN